ncbi:MAG: hypothetical protein GY820_06015 [Gammaproteobacteria bacterium]|nr:hypothetical protein [Gammaproteobacteria bacterium]
MDGLEMLEKLKKLKQELVELPPWVAGTVIETTRKQSKTEKPFYYLSQSVKGKTKTTYIAAKHLGAFKKAEEEGGRLKQILTEINQINIQLIKSGAGNAAD